MHFSKFKYLLALCFVVCATNTSAQKWRSGVYASYTNNSSSLFNAKSGYQIGAKAEWNIVKGLNLQGGLAIEQRYYGGGIYFFNQKWYSRPIYFDIPISVGYKWNIAPNVKINVAVGPKFSVGMIGKYNLKTLMPDGVNIAAETGYHGNAYKDGQEGILNRFDVALGGEVGVELFNHYQLSVGYNKGLRDITKQPYNDNHNRQWQVSLGYMF